MKVRGIAEKLALKLYSGETGQKGDISAGNQSGTILTGVQKYSGTILAEVQKYSGTILAGVQKYSGTILAGVQKYCPR